MAEGGGSKDFAVARTLARREPELFADLVALLADAVIEFLSGQVEAGAEALQLFDSWAGALPPAELERWVVAPTRRIVRELRRRHPQRAGDLLPARHRCRLPGLRRGRAGRMASASIPPCR